MLCIGLTAALLLLTGVSVSGAELPQPSVAQASTTPAFSTIASCSLVSSFLVSSWQPAKDASAPEQQRSQGWGSLRREFNWEEIDLQQLSEQLGSWGIPLPIALSGTVSVQLNGSIPWNSALNPRTYKLDGQLESEALTVEGRVLSDVQVLLKYRDGRMDLRELSFRLPDEASNPRQARLVGRGTAELIPQGKLSLKLAMTEVPLSRLLQGLAQHIQGTVSGDFAGEIELAEIASPEAWQATATVTIDNLTAAGFGLDEWTINSVASELAFQRGTLNLQKLAIEVDPPASAAGLTVRVRPQMEATASLELFPPGEAAVQLSLADLPVAWLFASLPGLSDRLPGTISGDFQGTTQLKKIVELAMWSARGTIRIGQVGPTGARLDPIPSLSLQVVLQEGTLSLDLVQAPSTPGEIRGGAQLSLQKPYAFSGRLAVQGGRLGNRQPTTGPTRESRNARRLRIQGSYDLLLAIEGAILPWQFRGSGSGGLRQVALGDLAIGEVRFRAEANPQQLTLKLLQASILGGQLTGSLTLPLLAQEAGQAQLQWAEIDLAKLLNSVAETPSTLKGATSGKVDLTIPPESLTQVERWSGTASISIPEIASAAGTMGQLQGTAKFHAGVLSSQLQGNIFSGELIGLGTLPLLAQEAAQAQIQWKGMDLAKVLNSVVKTPLALRGSTSGKVGLTIPPEGLTQVERWSGTASISIPKIASAAGTMGQLQGSAKLASGSLAYQMQGKIFSGDLAGEGTLPLKQLPGSPGGERTDQGRFRLAGLSLASVSQALSWPSSLRLWDATLAMSVNYRHRPSDDSPMTGSLSLSRLQWNQTLLAERLQGRLRWQGSRFSLQSFSGGLAGGQLNSNAVFDWGIPRRGNFSVSLQRVQSDQVLAWWKDANKWVSGVMSLQLQGNLANRWAVGGVALVSRGTVGGLPVSNLRIPLAATLEPNRGLAQIKLTSFNGQMAHGRLRGNLGLTWRRGIDLKGQLKFTQLHVRELLGNQPTAARWGSGTLSGSARFQATDLKQLNDLSGTIKAKIKPGRAASPPVLRAVGRYVRGGRLLTFDEGSLRATFKKGLLRISRLTLSSRNVRLFAQGTASLVGRLDLQVAVDASVQPINSTLLSRFPTRGALPASLLAQANELLSVRVISLQVTGTLSRPAVRVRPLPRFRTEGVRYFLGRPNRG